MHLSVRKGTLELNNDRFINWSNAQPAVEVVMQKLFVGPLALVIAGLPVIALAQTTSPGSQDRQSVTPTSPNSGAGIPGQPGNKSGPAAKRSGTTGSDVNSGTSTQDTSKVPGKPGGKSGPPARSPSSTK
jgi:hypothetical protein